MSDTPETDAVFIWETFLEVDVNKAQKLCEKLERERDEARRECKFLWDERDEARELLASEKITRNHIIKRSVEVERERDEARAIAYDLASVASHCLGWHDHESSEAAERIADTLKIWRSTQPCKK